MHANQRSELSNCSSEASMNNLLSLLLFAGSNSFFVFWFVVLGLFCDVSAQDLCMCYGIKLKFIRLSQKLDLTC